MAVDREKAVGASLGESEAAWTAFVKRHFAERP